MTKREEPRESSSGPRPIKPMAPEDRALSARERRAAEDEIPPALRTMLVSIRAGLLQAADAIADYLGLEKRRRDFD